MQTTPKALVLDGDCAAEDSAKAMPEMEIGHYSTGAAVTLWNTGGMAPGGTDGKDSFGRKVCTQLDWTETLHTNRVLRQNIAWLIPQDRLWCKP